jgi:MoaA/NifB/PqqE/SkfB family radical SAM enzyme
MFDIAFYMKVNELKKQIAQGEIKDRALVLDKLEEFRHRRPVIYNIETTNACNMRCKMCPRTTMMTRPIETMNIALFQRLVDQIEPHSPELWRQWERFAEREYGILKDSMSENHFFLYIIPRVIQLHGYGDPLLDRNMADHVALLTSKGFLSYFSCNPANINIDTTVKMFENGLDYIKYSIESVDDQHHKKIRGQASDFTESYKRILKLLEIKKDNNFKTKIIITMLDLNQINQKDEFERLRKTFAGLDVYIYLKSEDQQWYRQDFHGTCSIHWSEFCKHPWMSMTIKSNGEAAMCMEDFNNEIILGDARKESLYDIWNGEKYHQLRLDHIMGRKGIKCTDRCDMKVVGHFL